MKPRSKVESLTVLANDISSARSVPCHSMWVGFNLQPVVSYASLRGEWALKSMPTQDPDLSADLG